jgi:hypothetical protein
LADHQNISRRLTSGGLKGKKQTIDLLSLSANDYVYRQAHPALRRLQLNMASLIAQQYGDLLNPQVSRIDIVLL